MKLPVNLDSIRPGSGAGRIGWICSYTPEELILAAGYVPVRVSSNEEPPETAEAYLPANICPYVRSLLETAIKGEHEFLEGMIFVLSCDAMRRLADVWEEYFKPEFLFRLDVPRRTDGPAEDFFVAQLDRLRCALEDLSGRSIGREEISDAIAVTNRTRELMTRLSGLRLSSPPAISGAGYHAILRASMDADRRKFNAELERLLDKVDRTESGVKRLPRLLLCGCVVDNNSLVEQIEECGATVVGEDVCTSLRHFEGLVDTSLEPLRGLARRYLRRAACARMAGARDRVDRIINLVESNHADGVIYHTLKFCDLGQSDLPELAGALGKAGIPLLNIDRDYSAADSGQLRTRLEAFLEVIAGRGE